MALNQKTLTKFYDGTETAAAALRAMEIEIPPIRLSQVIPEGLTRNKVRKLLNLLPITSLEIDLEDYWGEPNEIMTTLTMSQFITNIRILNCNDTIIQLPISTREVEIHASPNTKAIKEVVKMENIRKIKLINGTIDTETLINTMERETWIENLELINTSIITTTGLCRSARILKFTTTNVKINGMNVTHGEVNKILYG